MPTSKPRSNSLLKPIAIPFSNPLAAGLVALALASAAHAGPVITWVAPYRVDASKAMLQRDFGGVGMKDGLTWLALQFWVTDGARVVQDGNVAGAGFDDKVKWFRDWGHAHGVKVTLCVTDYVGSWNWPEAVRSFNGNRAAFVKALAAEVERLDLDGVELDLEGTVEATTAESEGFIAFSADLATAMHAKGKTVTVASFAAQWNAPNWKWWPELMKTVDGVTSMGYESAGRASTHGYGYPDQKKHAVPAGKLMIGMPGGNGSWEGNTVMEQLDWVLQDGAVGVGIWDCALDNGAWQTAAVWQRLAKIKAAHAAGVVPAFPGVSNAVRTERFDSKGRKLPNAETRVIRIGAPVFSIPIR
jgi:hypothetical protein